ncbi:23S rRNA (uracil(1939)-C(5))-methyltransferase RlmD [Liquorilactobacillus sicerae]|uniref:23S rRNA (uracil(1939)-C(5))-methyltransferase RlmD n=1 Tax=Liquorilactobacillus sicerae TaxID=1416943 RepID=UPI0024808ED3|nr:23S rRNA (uracil(1939)-C(5))-methyltransferase RlmD [Liquorilactobacillus sicerae]
MFKNQQQNSVKLTVGQRIPLTIKRLGINGEGIGYYKHKIVFVTGALPGEVVVAEISKIAKSFASAKIHRIRQKSPDRVAKRDQYDVGGIELEHLSYSKQLEFKRDIVKQALRKYHPMGYKNYQIKPMLGMKEPYYYRNKAQFQVRKVNGQVIAGLYRRGSHQLVDLPTFTTQRPLTMKIIRQLCRIIEELQLPVYDEKKNAGIIKTLIVRESTATGQAQVTIVTNSEKFIQQRAFIERLTHDLPEVVSLMQNYNPGKTSLIWGEKTKRLYGQQQLTEKIADKKYKLSAQAFFQLNSVQTAKLYQAIADALDLTGKEKLIDAYCGAGTIGIYLADQVAEVRGMDIIPAAIDDARQNAKLNHCFNTHYECGKAEQIIPYWQKMGFVADAIVVDPPRTGLDRKLISSIIQSRTKNLIYVSCNPSTLARDLVWLTKKYQVAYILPIDMFPQTARIEALVKLNLRVKD